VVLLLCGLCEIFFSRKERKEQNAENAKSMREKDRKTCLHNHYIDVPHDYGHPIHNKITPYFYKLLITHNLLIFQLFNRYPYFL
jgi:hypothetical protein